MPLKHILKNKLLLQKHFHLQEISMDEWPFWMLEENVKLVNEIIAEEETNRKKQEDDQSKGMGNFNANSMMSSANDMTRSLTNNTPKF
jgi:hypothetical protein